ncbi:MAG TPA: hypothetical protein PKA13_25275 [Geminicoccaceae bacterium]|nr:hypothetical protein [Geminicoccus sp.]HMU53109.1 hypothetical protein [Geminicoccaceae bacterium]
MAGIRLVSIDGLRRRLSAALADEPLLRQRFERALATQDEALIEAAMDCLRLYPAPLRERVEAELITWLFDQPDDLPVTQQRSH